MVIFPFAAHQVGDSRLRDAEVPSSNSISKVKQGGDERTTQAVQIARPGVSAEANAVSQMKWNWN
jgi:hypothetical protein